MSALWVSESLSEILVLVLFHTIQKPNVRKPKTTQSKSKTMAYKQFTFYDCMYTRWRECGEDWKLLNDGPSEWKRMADIIPFRLITLDPVWVDSTPDCIALKIDGGEMDTATGHMILFTIAQDRPGGVVMMCKVFEDSDTVQVTAKGKVIAPVEK
jgi:hypothetical protein